MDQRDVRHVERGDDVEARDVHVDLQDGRLAAEVAGTIASAARGPPVPDDP